MQNKIGGIFMKKTVFQVAGVICLVVVLSLLCILPTMASEDEATVAQPECFWPMDTNQSVWVGENSSLDFLEFSDYYEATEARLYNVAWAGRYGGVAINAKNIDVTVSSEKNRYLVINVMPDYEAVENHFDKFSAIYWKSEDAKVYYIQDAADAFSVLHNAPEEQFQKIIIDLNWQEEFVLETLRLEIFSTSYETSSDSQDGYNCGNLYFEYIALFDTLDEATNYVYKTYEPIPTQAPTNAPEDPENTQAPTSAPVESTQKPITTTKPSTAPNGGDDAADKKSPVVGIVIGAVVVIAVIAVVLVLKPKKK